MALATQSAGLVRQKAYNAVYGTGTGTSTNTVSPYHFYAIKAFFLHMAANKGNPDLQFIPYSSSQIATAAGYNPDVDVCTLYVWFAKARRTTGTNTVDLLLLDAAAGTDTGVVQTAVLAAGQIKAAGDQFLFVWPNGKAVATDITIQARSDIGGGGDTTGDDSAVDTPDAADGFVIVSA